ncbi:MAG: class I SAM-dependent methyltransferase [Nocardioides sp.]
MNDRAEAVRRVAKVFDEVAEDYDQSGVSFFEPIAQCLVELLDPRPGERLVDVGCGRGALTFPAARAVGPEGRVTAADISPTMLDLTRRAAEEDGLSQVETVLVTPDALGLTDGVADVVASSLVLFFAPDPEATLRSWMSLLAQDGRIGISTFGEADSTWKRIEGLFAPHLPPALLDARTSGETGPFASDEGVARLFAAAGAADVQTVRRPLEVHFDDAAAWRRFSMSTGQRAFWRFVPEERREPLFEEAAAILEDARTDDGDIVLVQNVRYTLGRRSAGA